MTQTTQDLLCRAANQIIPGVWRECEQPATEIWDYACVHEHVRRRATCAQHRPQQGAVGCRTCWEAGHDCDMVARQVGTVPG